jgi:hypothetical protein
LAGESDLIDKAGNRVPTLNLDACNFSPRSMDFGAGPKHWDILYVARGVFFKGIEHFFECIRELYNSGHRYRVLFLCPAPPEKIADTEALIAQYEKMFSLEERKYFNFLVLRENYPFFFDLPTLTHFYQSSRIFVHTADEERRCRVAAYAFCTGLPVVGMDCVGSILSEPAKKGVFFEVKTPKDFAAQVSKALSTNVQQAAFDLARRELSEVFAVDTLKTRLQSHLKESTHWANGKWFTQELDIRLGRHHGLGGGPNSLNYNLASLMKLLLSDRIHNLNLKPDVDAELALNSLFDSVELNTLSTVFKVKSAIRLKLARTKNNVLKWVR